MSKDQKEQKPEVKKGLYSHLKKGESQAEKMGFITLSKYQDSVSISVRGKFSEEVAHDIKMAVDLVLQHHGQ